jgi:hypothetical protein
MWHGNTHLRGSDLCEHCNCRVSRGSRHHCRACACLICDKCSPASFPLLPRGTQVDRGSSKPVKPLRVCSACHNKLSFQLRGFLQSTAPPPQHQQQQQQQQQSAQQSVVVAVATASSSGTSSAAAAGHGGSSAARPQAGQSNTAGNEPARRVAKTKCVHARTSRVLEQREVHAVAASRLVHVPRSWCYEYENGLLFCVRGYVPAGGVQRGLL